jgi:hypothetical protein
MAFDLNWLRLQRFRHAFRSAASRFFKRRVFLVSRLGPGNSHPPEAVVFLGLESSFWAA